MKATRKALLALAVLAVAMALVVARGSRTSTASASTTMPIAHAPVVPSTSPAVVADRHDTELSLALHDLETGATCDDRMHAIERLLELRDANAVTALRTARVRRDNSCLRSAAAQAIKALDGRI